MIDHLRALSHPAAESMPDGERLTRLIIAAREAANELQKFQSQLDNIEKHVKGLVSVHSQFSAAAQGSWSGKKQKVRASEAAQILSFIKKVRKLEGW